MVELTVSAQVEVVFRHLASPVVKRAAPLLACENAVTKVRRMLLRVQAALADAEARHQAGDPAVAAWLAALRDVACDADDLFDEMSTRVQQAAAAAPELLLSFAFPRRVEEIADRLDEVAKGRAELRLSEVAGGSRAADGAGDTERPGPSLDGGRVFGRDAEREELLRLLLSGEPKRRDLDVVPVVGTCGIGKTTLARLVFDEERVERHFKMRIWVSVSRDLDARRLMKAIIECATGDRYLLLGVDAMQRHLRQVLGGKRYLLMLDDVRDENCVDWQTIDAALLAGGAKGSRVLVTTSSESVARAVGTRPAYHLKGLPFEDCWSLFGLYAFGGGVQEPHFDLAMVGKSLVKKCKGLPLAVKALGGLLHAEKDESKWRGLLKRQIWRMPENKNVSYPVLKLSYVHLPMHLKRCFLYCSILPRNFEFGKELLVKLWMAQGFVVPKGGIRLEDLGLQYFDELLWRSFFQFSHLDREDGESKYTVHEVIHDFARFMSGGECGWIECDDAVNVAGGARHVSLAGNQLDNLSLETFSGTHALRTFLFTGEYKMRELQVPEDYFLKMKCLRVLDLGNTSLHTLPASIGNLIHLRYLGLFNTQIEMLPESIGNLFELQCLDLGDCFELKELPKGMTRLVNLRHLNLHLHQCKMSGLSSFPPGFGQLKNLQTLSTFVVGSKDGCLIGELEGMMDLRGHLCISRLENVTGEGEADKACLRKKHYINKLELQWTSSKADRTLDEKVLENLKPHINLKELVIRGYGGATFAAWMGDPSFVNLISLSMYECLQCHHLPPLGLLPSLRYLSLEKAGVKHIGEEFRGLSKQTSFPSLEILRFESLLHWEEWSGLQQGDMPLLKELHIIGCSQLKVVPSLCSSLKKLEVWNCFGLTSLPKLQSVENLVLRGPSSSLLKGLWGLTSLEHLEIKNCPELTSISSNIKNLLSLRDLVLHDCKQLTSLPEELTYLSSLETLEISGCSQLQSLPKGGVPSYLQFVNICNCPLLSVQCQKHESEEGRKLSRVFSASIDGQKISYDEVSV